ncbi:MAG TPA: ATP-binding protein [Polyangiaceae bacterium]|jgi:signal transduction histidine kinase
MHSGPSTFGPSFTTRHKARFDALKRQLFAEMACATARYRFTWIVPFNFGVMILLAVRGMSPLRLAIEALALFGSAGMFKARLRAMQKEAHDKAPAGSSVFTGPVYLFTGGLFYFLGFANTGGISSPLLLTSVPLAMSAALHPIDPKSRNAFFLFYAAGMLVLAFCAHTVIGQLPPPLASSGSLPSPEYVVLAVAGLIITLSATYFMGLGVTKVYEQVGLELAERREEICSESTDRTRALEGIAARLAHEVKNPLAAIKGLSTHMARSAADPKVAERLAIVAAEADRLQGIVDGFLSFSRGLDDLQVGPVVPHAVARELALLLETRAADSGVKLEVKGSEELVLNADGRKLRQALLNLVLNAMQASPVGETVTIEVAKCCGGAACVKVIDRGAGMTPEVLERIRKPYFTTREGGTGLGVAVARGLIDQHGGHLHYESRPGKGTTVTIDLPACALAAAIKSKLPNPVHKPETAAS